MGPVPKPDSLITHVPFIYKDVLFDIARKNTM